MIETLIKRKITTLMIFLGICLLGGISLSKLPLQLMPDIEFPKLTIVTSYANASPSEVEKLITKHIEEAVTSVNGVLSLNSESIEGLSLVTARFRWGTNMDLALIETKEKVDIIKSQLPQDTDKSIVIKFDPKASPVMIYTIIGLDENIKNMRKRIEKEIVPYVERIEGVASVDVSGGYKRQINIDLDSGKIFSHKLALSEILQNLNFANYSFPAGYVEKGNKEYLIRTIGEFKKIKDIDKVVVAYNKQGTPVYLKDIASIKDSYKDRKSIIRMNGKEAIGVLIKKEPGKNIINVCSKIKESISSLENKYKKEFVIQKIYDQSEFIDNSINNVFTSAVLGGIISIFVLFFFLKELRSPLIIATTIPISIMGTFSLMYFQNISINTMSLGGLALGVGMMVDAGIVVLESIVEKKNLSKKKLDTAQIATGGTRDVIGSVVASTLTTIVVFLPITFISGLSGAVFGELALTISFALICSLLCSFSLIPMLYTFKVPKQLKALRSNKIKPDTNKIHNLSDAFMDKLNNYYNKIIKFSLNNSKLVLTTGCAISIIGIVLFSFIDFELMPKVDPGEFTINIELPKGTTLSESSAFTSLIERKLRKKSYIKYIYAKIGSDPEENISEKISGKSTNNISIQIILSSNRSQHISKIINNLKKELIFNKSIQIDYNLKENVISSIFSQRSKPVTIEIYGKENDLLKRFGDKIIAKLSKLDSLYNIKSIMEKGHPELKINIDRNKMSSFEINIESIASTLRSAIHGEVATKMRTKDDEIDIKVRLRKTDRSEKNSIYKILIKSAKEEYIPLARFIDISEGSSPSKILRSEQSRVNIITADIKGKLSNVYSQIEDILSQTPLKDGYDANIVGEKDEILKSLGEMRFALILAIILIYMLLASQFQSFKNPLIVMLSIPVTSFGISFSLLITGKTININSGIGIILLAGIVVNNAIVLFDYIEYEIRQKVPLLKSIIIACNRRLKPIIMTTATTVLAMIPLALGIGEGSEIQQPMAIAVIGGLLFSTFLTLVFIPTVYFILNNKTKK